VWWPIANTALNMQLKVVSLKYSPADCAKNNYSADPEHTLTVFQIHVYGSDIPVHAYNGNEKGKTVQYYSSSKQLLNLISSPSNKVRIRVLNLNWIIS